MPHEATRDLCLERDQDGSTTMNILQVTVGKLTKLISTDRSFLQLNDLVSCIEENHENANALASLANPLFTW